MFRSTRRSVVFPQAVHARLAASIAAVWGNPPFERPAVPFASFVHGVALHDRGYGELDTDGVGEVPPQRWIEIQRQGFAPRGDDPIVDLVVALHVHRLVSKPRDPVEAAALPEMEAALPALLGAAGVAEGDAKAINSITHLCDRISLTICFEEASEWTQPVVPEAGQPPVDVTFMFEGEGRGTLSPWPLGIHSFTAVVPAYRADDYPETLSPQITIVSLQPH
jgi:Protein of unknown function (DUF3891)